MKTDSLPEIFVSRQEAARTGSLLANCLLQKILDTTDPKLPINVLYCLIGFI